MEDADALGLVGTTIAEKYAVESVVGEGGFAVVYRALHVVWKRPVAVKVFKALGEVHPQERQKLLDDFIQEGRLLADLSERSSAICQARDVGMLTTPGGESVPYMVLEWLEGRSLDAAMERERAAGFHGRSLDEAIHLLEPAAEALALAHKKGVAHRDVKPANVFVLGGDSRAPDVAVKLLDFGIAKVVQDAQKMGFGRTAGHITSFTPSYGAPEQFNRSYGATGPWTDVFALALVLVELLTEREPLSGDSLVELAHAASDPAARPTPRRFGMVVTDAVENVFLRALAVQPEQRFATAGDFWSALRVAAGLGATSFGLNPSSSPALARTELQPGALSSAASAVPAPPFSTTGPFEPPSPTPKRALPAVLGLGAVALAGLAAGLFFLLRPRPAPPRPTLAVASAAPAGCPKGTKRIEGGDFFMGSDEPGAEPNEKPPHKVTLGSFCLDEFEVTVAQYRACSEVGGCLRAAKVNQWPGITDEQRKIYDPLCTGVDTATRADYPVNCVDWTQAQKYCEAQGARLPTEAEWEFAARGSDGRTYPWGDEPPAPDLLNACGAECVAWLQGHPDPSQPKGALSPMYAGSDGYATLAPVGRFPKGASRSGIQDIVGNVGEWVADWYGPYEAADARDPRGPDRGSERVIRGGAWNGTSASWVRPSFRFQAAPDFRTHGIGFRCARSL